MAYSSIRTVLSKNLSSTNFRKNNINMILLDHLLVLTCCIAASTAYSVDVAANIKDNTYIKNLEKKSPPSANSI